jgi:hypothetical protein
MILSSVISITDVYVYYITLESKWNSVLELFLLLCETSIRNNHNQQLQSQNCCQTQRQSSLSYFVLYSKTMVVDQDLWRVTLKDY